MADLPLLLDAQDLAEVDARNGREGRALAGRLNRKARVMGGQVDFADEGVGRLDAGYAGEPELLDQTILERCEHPLRAASRLRRIGPDMLDSDPRAVTLGKAGGIPEGLDWRWISASLRP